MRMKLGLQGQYYPPKLQVHLLERDNSHQDRSKGAERISIPLVLANEIGNLEATGSEHAEVRWAMLYLVYSNRC